MKSRYNIIAANSFNSSRFRRFKECLYVIRKMITEKHFIFVSLKDENEKITTDIVNYNVGDDVTIQTLNSYTSILSERRNHHNKLNKNLEEWLRLND